MGELNDDSLIDKPQVGYGTLYYGLNNTFTGYAGAQYTDMDFYAGILGLAMNTPIGAFALTSPSRTRISKTWARAVGRVIV